MPIFVCFIASSKILLSGSACISHSSFFSDFLSSCKASPHRIRLFLQVHWDLHCAGQYQCVIQHTLIWSLFHTRPVTLMMEISENVQVLIMDQSFVLRQFMISYKIDNYVLLLLRWMAYKQDKMRKDTYQL